MAAFGRDTLLELYHHVVLPRDVPGSEHRELWEVENDMAARLVEATKTVSQYAPLDDLPSMDAIRLVLSTCKSLHVDGKVDKHLLLKELHDLHAPHALILHITEQNAALLVYPHTM